MIPSTKPIACVFDWDGTLVDSTEFILGAHSHVYKILGCNEPSYETLKNNMRFSTRDIYPKLFGDKWEYAIDVLDAYILENHIGELSLREDVDVLLKTIHAMGVPMAVVSNKRHKFLVPEVESVGFDAYFGEAIIGAGHANRDKPHADPIFLALDRLGISRDCVKDVWFFGDTITDLECASNLGMPYLNCSIDTNYCESYYNQHGSFDIMFLSFSEIVKKLVCNF